MPVCIVMEALETGRLETKNLKGLKFDELC